MELEAGYIAFEINTPNDEGHLTRSRRNYSTRRQMTDDRLPLAS